MRTPDWIQLRPDVGRGSQASALLHRLSAELPTRSSVPTTELELEIERYRRHLLGERKKWPQSRRDALAALVNVIADLAKQGWEFRARNGKLFGRSPDAVDPERVRERRREQLAARRSEQLRE